MMMSWYYYQIEITSKNTNFLTINPELRDWNDIDDNNIDFTSK